MQVMLTRLDLPAMARLARNNGAQSYLVKSQVAGDDLDKAIGVIGANKHRQP